MTTNAQASLTSIFPDQPETTLSDELLTEVSDRQEEIAALKQQLLNDWATLLECFQDEEDREPEPSEDTIFDAFGPQLEEDYNNDKQENEQRIRKLEEEIAIIHTTWRLP